MFDVRGKEEEVLICLQQEDRRVQRKEGGGENLPIGFEVLKVSSAWTNISTDTTDISSKALFSLFAQVEVNRCSRVQCVVEQAASSIYMDSRSVTLRGTLAPGRYVVLPTTFLPGATGRFLLRLFSHSRMRLRCETPGHQDQERLTARFLSVSFILLLFVFLKGNEGGFAASFCLPLFSASAHLSDHSPPPQGVGAPSSQTDRLVRIIASWGG